MIILSYKVKKEHDKPFKQNFNAHLEILTLFRQQNTTQFVNELTAGVRFTSFFGFLAEAGFFSSFNFSYSSSFPSAVAAVPTASVCY